jgi:hypothetical protein
MQLISARLVSRPCGMITVHCGNANRGETSATWPTPGPTRFGHLEALGGYKSNWDKRLRPHSLPATGFILARSESRLATVLAGGLAFGKTALVIGGRGWQLGKLHTLRLNPADARRLKNKLFLFAGRFLFGS